MANLIALLKFTLYAVAVAGQAKKGHQEVLGVSKDASLHDIQKAYRSLALQFHPDRASINHLDAETATKKFQAISEAYEQLSQAKQASTVKKPKSKHQKHETQTHFDASQIPLEFYLYGIITLSTVFALLAAMRSPLIFSRTSSSQKSRLFRTATNEYRIHPNDSELAKFIHQNADELAKQLEQNQDEPEKLIPHLKKSYEIEVIQSFEDKNLQPRTRVHTMSPIEIASAIGREDVVYLLRYDEQSFIDTFFSRAKNDYSQAFIYAAENGHIHVLKTLVNLGRFRREINFTFENNAALRLASANGHTDVVQFFLEAWECVEIKNHPVQPDGPNYREASCAIIDAAINGHLEIVKTLSRVTHIGNSWASIHAYVGAYKDHPEISLWLLENNIRVFSFVTLFRESWNEDSKLVEQIISKKLEAFRNLPYMYASPITGPGGRFQYISDTDTELGFLILRRAVIMHLKYGTETNKEIEFLLSIPNIKRLVDACQHFFFCDEKEHFHSNSNNSDRLMRCLSAPPSAVIEEIIQTSEVRSNVLQVLKS